MATWISHLRIAENLIKTININDHKKFIVGNIGPDCGVPNEDWSQFTPPGEISHWRNTQNREINYSAFYKEYCELSNSDFYLGYYIHLITDSLWGDIIYSKKKEKYKKEMNNNSQFIWTMKEDWYDLDKVFLNENVLRTYEIFRNIEIFPNEYFEFYPEDAFTRQIKYISNFYDSREREITKTFKYLTKHEMDTFVDVASEKIINELMNKNSKIISQSLQTNNVNLK